MGRAAAPARLPAEPGEPPRRGRGRALCWPATVAVVSAVVFLCVRGSLIDDAFITLGYARNLAEHFHWGLVRAETANSATSPLNVLLLALGGTLTRVAGGSVHPVAGAGLVFVAAMTAVGWGFARVARVLRLPFFTAVAGTAAILVNPFVLSATGLEVHLIAAALLLLTAYALEGRAVGFGVVAGLAVLVRLDLVIFVVLLTLGVGALRRRLLPVVAVALAVCLPWFVFSWFALGSAIPDTFLIKTTQGAFGEYTYGNGPVYYLDPKRWKATLVAFAPAFGGLVALLGWSGWLVASRERAARFGPVAALGFGGLLYYGAYSLLGVPPYQWYYVAPIVALTAVFVVAAGWLARGAGVVRVAVAGLAFALAVLPAAYVDVRRGVPWAAPPIFGNWATAADYARVGQAIGAQVGDATVAAPPEIGTLAYFCECTMVDSFADQGRVVPLVEQRIAAAGPVDGFLLKLDYRWLDRARRPRPVDYRLDWSWSPLSGPGTWHLFSPATGDGWVRLVRI
ncbi:hypothetical protein VSH64_12325 [Amycolatopsis rhabdoformis]|uniref:Glycosyltransferase RgtA/B/C/D-like domain-containing protein n=1 Tax=Amycolatopsis rhabdoformis TaxID=1448059 RepID=A0ABZ1IEP0_9PSEU|nr:hypothetical protein [Amycolatopsis rhabdoformis]WSE32892.1 hypothetical protein VSH64_12325 [Amycolatopsis rhabdoformis]